MLGDFPLPLYDEFGGKGDPLINQESPITLITESEKKSGKIYTFIIFLLNISIFYYLFFS